jgi:hypothetical protein
MFSSRAATRVFGDTTLTELRLALKAQVEGIRIGGHQPFEVWIHEDDPAPAGRTILEGSLDEISRADVVLVLYTGEAGSAEADSSIGICHAELQEALARRRDVVSVIALEPLVEPSAERDEVFQGLCHPPAPDPCPGAGPGRLVRCGAAPADAALRRAGQTRCAPHRPPCRPGRSPRLGAARSARPRCGHALGPRGCP